MLKIQKSISAFIAIIGFVFLNANNSLAEITLSHSQITDVTPSSFSVIWHASETSTPRIEIYSDSDETLEITNQVEVIPFPVQGSASGLLTSYEQVQSRLALQSTAKQKGLNKILVRGLSPNTTYFLRVISESELDSGMWPAIGTQLITTQIENRFIQDSAILEIDPQDASARGWLVAASVADSTHPVSAFVDAGAEAGQAVINLSNLFGSDGINWNSDLTTTVTIQIIKESGELVSETLDINLSNSFAVANNFPYVFTSPFDAIIQIASPSQKTYSSGESVTLAWTDTAEGLDATISLYADVDNQGEDGVLIASGISEDADGVGDQYDWDVNNVSDGSYYIYAVMSDGENTVSSYSSAKVTVDVNQTDTDGDLLSDLWETHYFDTLARDGNGDFDGDGVPDNLENFYSVDPEQINAPLDSLTLALEKGSHIIGVPGLLVPSVNSYGLLQQLGTDITSVSRYNPTTKLKETAYWDNGNPAGDLFYLLPGEGYFVQMAQPADLVWAPFDANRGIPLKEGMNVIALTSPTGDAFGIMDQLGSDVIWSIRRLNSQTALYETAAFDGTNKVGVPFPMRTGEGYIVTVKQDGSL